MKYLLLTCLLLLFFVLSLFIGSIYIPPLEILSVLTGGEASRGVYSFIILSTRLPQALTAILCGAALSTSGLLLQTAFRNPLAGPGVFGVSSGASMGVAFVMLAFGGTMSLTGVGASGMLAVLLGAFLGAIAVTILLLVFSAFVRGTTMLLIVGIMTGYLASSVVALLNFWASAEGLRTYVLWGMGSFSAIPARFMPFYIYMVIACLLLSLLLIKPLNLLQLGERYAKSLGLHVENVRRLLLLLTGMLTAITTAFCGPVSFIGLAVPHLARLVFRTADHRQLLPNTMLIGAIVALGCQLICQLPVWSTLLPINVVTPLLGAPTVLYVILKKK
ncbi:MAG: iron ABC transporter permease [Bacteroidaceae bacterium]|nr:iron ABC transporter permease [Prevotellaceae bacterium]MDY5631016.1 iron ABC transporter permease [Bacteroidaceae bacterium]